MTKVQLRRVKSSSASGIHMKVDFLRVACTSCRAIMTLEKDFGGKPVRCSNCKEFFIAPKKRFSENTVLGDYILLEHIGRTDLEKVYRAFQRSLNRECAVKILTKDSANDKLVVDAHVRAVQNSSKLNHPNIAQFYAVGREDDAIFYSMEYVDGESLSSMLNHQTRLSTSQAVDIIFLLTEALKYAWAKYDTLHLRIQPDDIMLTSTQEVKLINMGVYHELHKNPVDLEVAFNPYVSPEQLQNKKVTHQSDIYCLGLLFYKMVTGRFPFRVNNKIELLEKITSDKVPNPKDDFPDLPNEFNLIIQKLLDPNLEDRYDDYQTLQDDLNLVRTRESDSINEVLTHRTSKSAVKKVDSKPVTVNEVSTNVTGKKKTVPIPALILLAAIPLVAVGIWFAVSNEENISASTQDSQEDEIGSQTSKVSLVSSLAAVENETSSVSPNSNQRIRITKLLPDPQGFDQGNEWIEITNQSGEAIDLSTWTLRDQQKSMPLNGMLSSGEFKRITLEGDTVVLGNNGNTLSLYEENQLIHSYNYTSAEVAENVVITVPEE